MSTCDGNPSCKLQTANCKLSSYIRLLRPRMVATAAGAPLSGVALGVVAGLPVPPAGSIVAACLSIAIAFAAGAVDSDIIDLPLDRQTNLVRKRCGRTRPIADGSLTLSSAVNLRLALVFLSLLPPLACHLGAQWWKAFGAMALSGLVYTRYKDYFTDYSIVFLAFCRAFAVVCGTALVYPESRTGLQNCQIGFFAAGEALYAAAVAYMGLGKEYAGPPLSHLRHLWAIGVFMPLAALAKIVPVPETWLIVYAVSGTFGIYAIWLNAMFPLGLRHKFARRDASVESALWMFPALQALWIIAAISKVAFTIV